MNTRHKLWLSAAMYVGVFGYWIAMFVATHVTPTVAKAGMVTNDKIIHGTTYFLLALGCALLWRLGRRLSWVQYAILLAGLMFYGAVDELTQPWVGRRAEWNDWLADCGGVASGLAIFFLLSQRGQQNDEQKPPYRRGVIN